MFWDRMLGLYSSFIRPGDIVFDIGANVGVYTEVFMRLGATVVAVEPNLECCKTIRRMADSNKRVIVETCAAGAAVGSTTLHICEDTAMSTVSPQWLEAVCKSELHKDVKWLNVIQVPVKTLDVLAKQYGEPTFVKIDSEGFDDQVLVGMSFRPTALSFELNVNALDVALRCLRSRVLRDGYIFNYTVGQAFRYGSKNWLNSEEMRSIIENFNLGEEYGEVFARRSP